MRLRLDREENIFSPNVLDLHSCFPSDLCTGIIAVWSAPRFDRTRALARRA